jgi:hypothetical protein
VEYDADSGNVTQIQDITRDLRGGLVFGGAVSICPTDRTIFVGVDARDGQFNDFVIEYAYNARGVAPRAERPLLYPITSGLRAFCSNIAVGFENVLYVEIPTGQMSFHTERRGDGPDYHGAWDGAATTGPERICRWCELLLLST